MRTVVIAPPAPIVGWTELDHHLRLGGDESQRAQVEAMAAAAQWHIDGPLGWLGRALGEQTLEARFNSFACIDMTLPFPEVIEVLSVSYDDAAGVEQTLPSGEYHVAGRTVSAIWGSRWPTTGMNREAVRIRYRAGFEAVPEPIKAAILIMVGDLYAGRETFAMGAQVDALPSSATVANLLAPYRVFT